MDDGTNDHEVHYADGTKSLPMELYVAVDAADKVAGAEVVYVGSG